MKKNLKYIDGNSDKFWQIEVTGFEFTVTYGKNGTSGTSQIKTFSTDEECLRVAEKLLAEKVKKGYSESGDVTIASKPKTAKSLNSNEVTEEYDAIIKAKNIDLLLPFLQEKSKGNLEALKKQIKKNKKFWTQYIDLSKEPEYLKKNKTNNNWGSTWGSRGDQKQKEIITLSAIALFDKTDINSWDEALSLLNQAEEKPLVMEVLLWAKPNWLETFILDKIKRQDWVGFSYHILRKFEDHNLLKFNPELYALALAAPNEWNSKIKMRDFIKNVLNDKLSYQRDIPELFNYETTLSSSCFNDNSTQKYNEFETWAIIYKSLLEEKKMDRAFFIENAILIQTKEWNNNLKSFFRKRIEEFNVTPDELIILQEKIFSYLHNPYPPITSYGIELVKKIYEHPKFKTKSFLEWLAPLMMRSDCKAAIKNVLPILEKITKSNPKLSANIADIIADVYVIADLALQERATKIILRIANVKDKLLKEKLSSYVTLMQGNIKSGLVQFLDDEELNVDNRYLEEYTFDPQKQALLIEDVNLPKNWNDILFQFGNFINSEEILDSEILLNAYISQRNLFPLDYNAQLQPYEKQLHKQSFESVHKNFVKAFLQLKIANIDNRFVSKVNHNSKINTLKLMQPLLEKVQQKIDSNSTLPLLSFPSHKPYWIAPKILLERLIAYQTTNEEIDSVDLAIAIARMPRENLSEAIPLLDNIYGELKQLLSFCLGVTEKIEFNISSKYSNLENDPEEKTTTVNTNLSLWAVAARTYYPNNIFTEFENTALEEVPFVVTSFKPKITFKEKWDEWTNYQTKEKEKSPSWYELKFELPDYSKILSCLLYSQDVFYSVYNTWDYNSKNTGNTWFWHSLTPQNSDALALSLLQNCFIMDGIKPHLKGFLNITNQPEFKFSDISLFLFACCFFQEKRDIRLLASEVLINTIDRQAIDVISFGKKIAYLATEKSDTFLRLVDGLIAIKDVSPLHNDALLNLLNSFFANLDLKEKLPTSFKKIVENYLDILTKTNQKPSVEAIVFFEKWKDNASLKSLIKQILK